MNSDLTRWNREGLERFRYVDGNAVTHLESLSRLLEAAFPDWPDVSRFAPGTNETPTQARERMLTQYQAESRDWAWQTLRTFARATHVLTEHIDAYANEAYLGTATQWDNLRRLVKMLDYHPRPPASATTSLVLIAKPGLSGVVEAGFQVKYAPEDGGAPVVFETLEDVAVDAALNGLRLEGWNRSKEPFAPEWDCASLRAEENGQPPPLGSHWVRADGGAMVDLNISAGQQAILLNHDQQDAMAVRLADEMNLADGRICLEGVRPEKLQEAEKWPWSKGDTHLLLGPKAIRAVRLYGDNVVSFSDAHGLSVGDIAAWQVSDQQWACARVVESDEFAIQLQLPSCVDLPPESRPVYRAVSIPRPVDDGEFRFSLEYKAAFWLDCSEFRSLTADQYQTVRTQIEPPRGTEPVYNSIQDDNIAEIFLLPTGADPVGTIAARPDELVVDGKPGNFRTGQWILGLGANAQNVQVLRIRRISEGENAFSIAFHLTDSTPDFPLRQVVGPFQETLRPQGYDANNEMLPDSHLPLDASVDEAALKSLMGRRIILERLTADGRAAAIETTVTEVDVKKKTVVVSVSPDENAGFTIGNTLIRGNVVHAGHGERKPAKVLGSGAATRSHQTFLFETPEVSFVPDPILTPGVRADIAITVGDQRWEQVSTLNDSGPTDAHYTVRMTEDGHLRVGFGDATQGRRLPTGTNNVRIGYRVGSGLRGNLPAGRLEKVVRPHRLIERVRQPLPATGGNDMEDKRSLRESAPSTLLTMERAVSLVDVANLARSHSSVWDAGAFAKTGTLDRYEHVDVTVVPAGGGELRGLQNELAGFLQAHGAPQMRVAVERFEDALLKLRVELQIDTAAFDPEPVQEGVKTALREAFTLRKRKIGQALSLGEVYQVVEQMRGVANSVCAFDKSMFEVSKPPAAERGPDGEPRIARPGPRQVLYLRDVATDLTLTYQGYAL